ncbi:acyltransferase family protein [Jiella sp. M17.18]|uniref:acyltransferase family protein n=1 Tax=Jiella sp. M17.18 TaxID=3234247 RepID=UPI0034DEF619
MSNTPAPGSQHRHLPVRFQALDGWRGVCALLIVCFHAPVAGIVHTSPFFRHAFLFVDFFFVLSGFVITHAFYKRLANERDFGRFFVARLFRVYPLHLFMLALFVAFECLLLVTRGPGAAFQAGATPVELVHNLLMTQALGFLDTLSWNYPSWSISAELVAYALFGLVVVVRPRLLVPLAALVIPLGLAAILRMDGTIDTTFHLGWLRCLVGFSLGSLIRRRLWTGRMNGQLPGASLAWTAAELSAVAMVGMFVAELGSSVLALGAPFVFGYALYVFAHEGGHVSRLLTSRPIAFLGTVSYSIYMTHAFILSRAENVATVLQNRFGDAFFSHAADGKRLIGANDAQALLALGIIVAGTLAMSALTYRFIEAPGIDLGRRLAERRTRASGRREQAPA